MAIAALLAAAWAVYLGALSAPFVFDDPFAIAENPTIRHLSHLGEVLSPPPYATGAAGRPLVNLTLALNYAVGGLDPRGYHAVNIALHGLAALALFGLIRRTLEVSGRSPPEAWLVALAATLTWEVHPLLTESVTCVIQRDEVLGALFYLATLYCFARCLELARTRETGAGATAGSKAGGAGKGEIDAPLRPAGSAGARAAAIGRRTATVGPRTWAALSVAACVLGIASKEFVATAPLLALLYDRSFFSGSFREAWRLRRGWYFALAATWIPLAWLMMGSRHRGGTVGFGLGVTPFDYLLTQCRAIAIYLKLSVWPHPLVIDYGTDLVRQVSQVAIPGAALVLLFGAVLASLRRPSGVGFLGAGFFTLLGPSSSIVPLVSQPIAEHRMYLPLAVIIVLAVTGLRALLGMRSLAVWPGVAAALGFATVQRNSDYRSEEILIRQSLVANPHNDRAYLNLGTMRSREGRLGEAISCYEAALRISPDESDTHYNLGAVLERGGRFDEAIGQYRDAVRLRADYPVANYRLGLVLAQVGRIAEAVPPLEHALELQPDSHPARRELTRVHGMMADADIRAGRSAEAAAEYEAVLRLDPTNSTARHMLDLLGSVGAR